MNNTWNSPVFQLPMVFRTSDDVSFWWTSFWWWECLWWRQLLPDLLSSELLVFRTSFLQMLQASFFLIQFVLQFLCFKGTPNFLSMVLHTWTNISISNWQFLIPCYHQNSKGNVKQILLQHNSHNQVWLDSPNHNL